jgi:hypothetical protein
MVKEKKVEVEVKEEEVKQNDSPNTINKTGNVKFTEA